MESSSVTISVVVPVYQSVRSLERALAALSASTTRPFEIIVVDDGSTDGSAVAAEAAGARVLRVVNGPCGPANARNAGAAAAQGSVLLFLDADVVVRADTVEKIAACFDRNPDIDAVFGSYDDSAGRASFASDYRNLFHHYVHQHGQREASTFWAGCGAMRRDVFVNAGGFDTHYGRPMIEDIELGLRLRERGRRIWLVPEIQVTHLKRWTYWQVVRTDIRDRAIPWTQLIIATRRLPGDLNLAPRNRFAAIAAWVAVFSLGASVAFRPALVVAFVAVLFVAVLNAPLYSFFVRKRGLAFGLAAAGDARSVSDVQRGGVRRLDRAFARPPTKTGTDDRREARRRLTRIYLGPRW